MVVVVVHDPPSSMLTSHPDRQQRNTVGRALYWATALALMVFGLVLRFRSVGDQIIADDDWHALHQVIDYDLWHILSHFGQADYSLPLTAGYELLSRWTPLNEWWLVGPSLVAGLGLLLLLPSWAGRRLGPCAGLLCLALMTIAPVLVLYARTARPYALVALLVVIAVINLYDWLVAGQWRRLLYFAACAATAGWLHPIAILPAVYAGVFGLTWMIIKSDWTRVMRLAGAGTATAVALAAVLVLPLLRSADWLFRKAGAGEGGLESLWRGIQLITGTPYFVAAILLVLLAGIGALRLNRQSDQLGSYLLFINIATVATIFVVQPAWLQHSPVWVRYAVATLPLIYLLVASGLAAAMSFGTRKPALNNGVAALVAIALFSLGPLPQQWATPNQFTNHPRYHFDYDPARNPYVTIVKPRQIPAIYRALATLPPGQLRIIEAPWRFEWHFNPLTYYQDIHRQRVRIGMLSGLCLKRVRGEYPLGSPLALRNHVHLGTVDQLTADLLVFRPQQAWPQQETPLNVSTCVRQLQERFGDSCHTDEQALVWSLSTAGESLCRRVGRSAFDGPEKRS